MYIATFSLLTASLLQAVVSTGSGTALCVMGVCCDWCISIRLLFLCTMVSSGVRWFAVRRWLWCFLIVGIHASSTSATLSLFMLSGLSLMWIASLAFLVYQWFSRSINFISFHSGLCPVPLACSETAEFRVRASRISLSCSFILSCMGCPVSPM